MAEGLNKAMLIGNLGAEPELRFTQNNRPVLKFRIATTESYVDQNKTRQEVTHWHNIVVWGPRGEALSKYLHKGSRVYIEGRIETRSYDDQQGVKRVATDIVANQILMLDGRGGGGGEGGGSGEGGGYGGRGQGGGGGEGGGGYGGRGQGGGGGYGGRGQGGGGGGRGQGGGGGGGGRGQGDEGDLPPEDFGGGGGGSDDDIPF